MLCTLNHMASYLGTQCKFILITICYCILTQLLERLLNSDCCRTQTSVGTIDKTQPKCIPKLFVVLSCLFSVVFGFLLCYPILFLQDRKTIWPDDGLTYFFEIFFPVYHNDFKLGGLIKHKHKVKIIPLYLLFVLKGFWYVWYQSWSTAHHKS